MDVTLKWLFLVLVLASEVTLGGRVRRQLPRRGCSDLSDCVEVTKIAGKIAYRCGTGSSMKICLALPPATTKTTTTPSTTTTSTTTTSTTTTPTTTTQTTTTPTQSTTQPGDNWIDIPDACVINYNGHVVRDVRTMKACKRLCEKEEEFKCRSIEYNIQEKICHLSKKPSVETPIVDPCNPGNQWRHADRTIIDPEPIRACADIVFVLDLSCSIPRKERIKGIQLIDQLSERLIRNTTGGAWIGVVPFSRKVIRTHVWRFSTAKNSQEQTLHSFLDVFDIHQTCTTRIRFAFQFANENYFKEPNDRNDAEYNDLMVVIGDGRTSSLPEVTRGQDYANAMATEQGVKIAWVKTDTVLVNRKKILTDSSALEKAIAKGDAEIADIVPDPSLIFSLDQEMERLNNPEAVGGLLQYIRDNYVCSL